MVLPHPGGAFAPQDSVISMAWADRMDVLRDEATRQVTVGHFYAKATSDSHENDVRLWGPFRPGRRSPCALVR